LKDDKLDYHADRKSASTPAAAEGGGTGSCEETNGGGGGHCDADSSNAEHAAHTQHGGGGCNDGDENYDVSEAYSGNCEDAAGAEATATADMA
jgi:hypothetical protein